MTIHVNIGDAKTRLSELIAAAVRGEEVVLDRAGQPQVRLVPVAEASEQERARKGSKRREFFGSWAKAFKGHSTDIGPSMSDEEVEERWQRKFGPAA